MSEKLENYIIGIMGRKGSGKTFFAQKSLINIKRYIIVDTLVEYEKGIIFDDVENLKSYIDLHGMNETMRLIYRPHSDEDMDRFFDCIQSINNYTLITEEVDYWCNSYNIHPILRDMIKYGRHKNKNIIWILDKNALQMNPASNGMKNPG